MIQFDLMDELLKLGGTLPPVSHHDKTLKLKLDAVGISRELLMSICVALRRSYAVLMYKGGGCPVMDKVPF
jgi:hypothetical protein